MERRKLVDEETDEIQRVAEQCFRIAAIYLLSLKQFHIQFRFTSPFSSKTVVNFWFNYILKVKKKKKKSQFPDDTHVYVLCACTMLT